MAGNRRIKDIPSKPRLHLVPGRKPASISAAGLIISYAVIILLTALVSPVSQSTLAPVYGSIPSSINHQEALLFTSSLGFITGIWFMELDFGSLLRNVAIFSFWIPTVSAYIYPHSQKLGLVGGPILLGLLSCHSLIISGTSASALVLKRYTNSNSTTTLFVTLLELALFLPLERLLDSKLPEIGEIWTTTIGNYSPVALQVIIATAFTSLSLLHRTKLTWHWLLVVPALLHSFTVNPHLASNQTTNALTHALAAKDWLLLERRWSNTGYLSVLENVHLGYRVLRCDHSLLGGEWLLTPERRKNEGWKVTESIYNVFEMLEAVRLVESDPPIRDRDAAALIIGLGIGTAPKAFIAHGINTTILELDPIVHQFATKYFDLPPNHTAILQDATTWAQDEAKNPSHRTYDYILHDVFTGGAEPLSLFTIDFISRLQTLLKPNGIIALNYAGDLTLPLTQQVMHTIDTVFNRSCRAFRDSSPPDDPKAKNTTATDFANLVIFCRKTAGPITFRKPRQADYLQSKSRQHYLLPSAEQEVALPSRNGAESSLAVLHAGDEKLWRAQQVESAMRHWKIMRTVMPDFVWELW